MSRLSDLAERLQPRPRGRCLLGLSGGADSVALLRMMLPLREAGDVELQAVHVNHGLRGDESREDEAFVIRLCADLQVPLHRVELDLGTRRDENSAREARYGAFRSVLLREDIPTLVLAHQRDDQAETFLMRLMRGAGPEGLEGMRPQERMDGFVILRPMLGISGRELREALSAEGFSWREDSTNLQNDYFRNRVRRELIPRMEEMAPGASERIARAAGLIAQDNDALETEISGILRGAEGREIRLEKLEDAPASLQSRALRRWWRECGPELAEHALSHAQTLRLTGLISSPRGTIINLPGGWRARREKETLRLLAPEDRTRNNRPSRRKTGKTDPKT